MLVVDDNATNRRILQELLRSWQMEPVLAENGEQGLAELFSSAECGKPFPLILLDYMMPEMDGLTFARRLRDDKRFDQTKILILSSATAMGDLQLIRELNIARRLMKPFKPSDLLNAILSVLDLETEAERQTVLVEPPTGRESFHILLAEDGIVNQRVAIGYLERRGHQVQIANNGKEAVEALERDTFDIVLMDVHMPEMDGFEATRAIRQKDQALGRHMPILAMTASAMKGDQEHAWPQEWMGIYRSRFMSKNSTACWTRPCAMRERMPSFAFDS